MLRQMNLKDAVDALRGLLSQWATKRLLFHKVEQITLPIQMVCKSFTKGDIDAPDLKQPFQALLIALLK